GERQPRRIRRDRRSTTPLQQGSQSSVKPLRELVAKAKGVETSKASRPSDSCLFELIDEGRAVNSVELDLRKLLEEKALQLGWAVLAYVVPIPRSLALCETMVSIGRDDQNCGALTGDSTDLAQVSAGVLNVLDHLERDHEIKLVV